MPFSGDIHEGSRQNNVNDIISLINKDIRFFRGCLAYQKLGKCVINDDVNAIMQKVLNADVIVWATPIYYYAKVTTSFRKHII